MIESLDLDELILVRKLREQIRRWWRLEIAYADSRGYVSNHARGVIAPSHNPFCEASLGSPTGFKRCNRSVAQATETIRGTHEEGGRVVQPCHLGLPLAMAPVAHRGHFYGTIFTGGFLIDDEAETTRRTVWAGAGDLDLEVGDRSSLERIPVLTRREVGYLCDLLTTAAEQVVGLFEQRSDPRAYGDLIGSSPQMTRLYSMLDKVADSDATVLITGENGTGKEVVAKALHGMGPRRDRSFVATNCSALNDNLLESTLFGHLRGSFTGAMHDKPGLFEVAHTGTLFLDEIGDTSAAMQVKLLRVLQEGTFLPVGATEPRNVDVRIVAATNRPLLQMVEEGDFREDLYYRLSVITLELPPLRERKGDLPVLVDHFLEQMRIKTGTPRRQLKPEVMRLFWEFDWPGNVRQLENEIERLVVLAGDAMQIGPELLSPPIRAGGGHVEQELPIDGTLDAAVRALEKRMIQQGLIRTGWNKSRLARELGLSRTTLIKKVREYGLEEGYAGGR